MESVDSSKRIAIVIALDRLCATKDYDAISIQDICAAAGLSRSTFYRVFSSKFEICTWYQDLLLDASIGQVGNTLDWSGAFCAFRSGWLLFPSMNLVAKRYAGMESVEVHWVSKMCDLILGALGGKGVVVDERLLFEVHYFSIATRPQGRRASTPWVDEIYDCSPEVYGQRMASVVPLDLLKLLNTPDHPNPHPKLTLARLFALA